MNVRSLGKRVLGLDTIRLALALCVVFGHIGLPISVDPSSLPAPWSIVAAIYANAFNGPAAVVCFFVVSGFCIHYPYRHQQSVELLPYFCRRHIRIWVPIAVAVVVAKLVTLRLVVFGDSILWSLIAEEIYYLLYPFFLWIKNRISWNALIATSYLGAFAVAASNLNAMNYPSFGIGANWILGLPCWLLGCRLAQNADIWGAAAASVSRKRIWFFRLVIVIVGTACSIARFHLGVGYPWSFTICSPIIFFWLKDEIVFYRDHPPLRLLEAAGMMTYSIYLTHLLAARFITEHFGSIREDILQRAIFFLVVLSITALFYFVVERPSHQWARSVARWILAKTKTGSQPNG